MSGERECPELVMKESFHVKEGLTGFEGQVQCRNLVEICDFFLDFIYEHVYMYMYIFYFLYFNIYS